jgi:hypothetical protein
VSNASLTPSGGWYADPMDAAQLRWWDGVSWTPETTPASAAEPLAPVTPLPIAPETSAPAAPEPAPAAAAAAPAPAADGPGIYIPRNSVFKMAEAVDGQAYVPEWSGLADISDEVALSGVPVQLALTATTSEGPPIPVSADAFPILGFTPEPVSEPVAPVWQVEQPLAKPIDQLFPLPGPAAVAAPAAPVAAGPVAVGPVAVGPVEAPPVAADAVALVPIAVVPPVPVPPVPVPPVAPAFAIAVSAAPEPAEELPTLSAAVFPTTAPEAALSVAPPPTGALFPGLVPTTSEPVAEPVAQPDPAVVSPALAAVPARAADPEPLAVPEAVAPQPVAPLPAAPQPELYAGPALVASAGPTPFDGPAPSLAPLAPLADPPGVGYEPLVARAIPQPVMFGAPVEAPAPTAGPVAGPYASPASPVLEASWPAEGTYQPHPGAYVPFDPNALHIEEPLPIIPFSSRDPYNPASTSRPALRSYGSAPVGPSGSTYTPALAIILLTPLLSAGGYALLFQLATINVGLAPNLALAGLLVALFFIGIGAAQFDRNSLARRGYFDLASPFWILLSPLVYLGVRASRLHSQGSGGIRAVFLWFGAWAGAAAILAFSSFAALTAVTPDRTAQTEQLVAQKFSSNGVVPKVDCGKIPSFASGTVFNCSVTSGGTARLVEVTITDWTGGESYRLIPTAAAAP